jgi:hypothetical protein
MGKIYVGDQMGMLDTDKVWRDSWNIICQETKWYSTAYNSLLIRTNFLKAIEFCILERLKQKTIDQIDWTSMLMKNA